MDEQPRLSQKERYREQVEKQGGFDWLFSEQYHPESDAISYDADWIGDLDRPVTRRDLTVVADYLEAARFRHQIENAGSVSEGVDGKNQVPDPATYHVLWMLAKGHTVDEICEKVDRSAQNIRTIKSRYSGWLKLLQAMLEGQAKPGRPQKR